MANTIDDLIDLRHSLQNGRAREIRERAGISAPQLARKLDVAPSTVTRWETGVRMPRGANARRYARILRQIAAAAGTAAQ